MGNTYGKIQRGGCMTTCGKPLVCEGSRSGWWYILPIFTMILAILAFAFVFLIPGVDLSNGFVIGILVCTIIAAVFAAVLIYYVYKYNTSCGFVVDCNTGCTGDATAIEAS